jgi:hypothetical protein
MSPVCKVLWLFQAYPLNPLLVKIAAADIMKYRIEIIPLHCTLHTDDIVIATKHGNDLQQAFDKLRVWAKEKSFEINK